MYLGLSFSIKISREKWIKIGLDSHQYQDGGPARCELELLASYEELNTLNTNCSEPPAQHGGAAAQQARGQEGRQKLREDREGGSGGRRGGGSHQQ